MQRNKSKHIENKYLAVQLLDSNIKMFLQRMNICCSNVCIHCIYTSIYASTIAEKLGYEAEIIHQITAGSLVHDLGKISVPQNILNKNGPLTQEEYDVMKLHSQFGQIQVDSLFSNIVSDIVLMHHEKLDGSGYPYGLTNIPEYVQIVTVADEYDALTSKRCYKKTFTPEEALEELWLEVQAGKLNEKIVSVIKDGWLR